MASEKHKRAYLPVKKREKERSTTKVKEEEKKDTRTAVGVCLGKALTKDHVPPRLTAVRRTGKATSGEGGLSEKRGNLQGASEEGLGERASRPRVFADPQRGLVIR